MPNQLSTAAKVARNTYFNSIAMLWNGAIAFFTTPYILYKLGADRYGLLGVSVALSGYAYLLDCSIAQTFIKHFAEYNAHNDPRRMNRVLNTTFAFYAVVAGASVAAILLFLGPIMSVLKVPDDLRPEAAFVFVMTVLTFALTSLFNVFSILQSGLQRLDVANKIAIYISIPQTAALFYVLEKGYGLEGMMWRALAVAAAYSLVNIWIARSIFPGIKLSLRYVDRAMLRTLLSFGLKVHVSRIVSIITAQTDRTFIALFLSLSAVTAFQLGNTLVVTLGALCGIIVSATTPAFSELYVQHGKEAVIKAYLRVSRYLACFTVPAFVLLMLSGGLLLKLWAGPAYAGSAYIICVLGAGYVFNILSQAGVSACQAIDRPQLMAASSVLNLVLNVGLNLLFITLLRERGIALGTSLGMAASACYFWFQLHSALGLRLKNLAEAVLPFVWAAAAAAAPVLAIDAIFSGFEEAHGRAGALVLFALRAAVFVAVYFAWLAYKKVFPAQELRYLRAKLSAIPFFCRFACEETDG